MSFSDDYRSFFKARGGHLEDAAKSYLKGLIQAQKANIERMEEAVVEAKYENMQYLISEAKWDHDAVLDKVSRQAGELLGAQQDAGLLVDESYFAKKGIASAGVARQWNGRLGKTENSQVGVFASLASGNRVCPIGARLYLPKEWTDDPARMRKANVPDAHQAFRTKTELALELIDRCVLNRVPFGWIGGDGFYGHCAQFLWELNRRGHIFALDLHSNQHVFESTPKPYFPKSKRDKSEVEWCSKERSFRVDSWLNESADAWQSIKVRNTTVGELWMEALSRRVWLFDKRTGEVGLFTLVITRDRITKKDVKYTISNAPPTTSLARLVYMIAQRFWVERGFQEAKQNTGMAEYQVRGWLGWHRHMVMVMMAQLFMLRLKVEHATDIKLLSCADIREVLAACLPNRRLTPGEVARQLRLRHEKRRKNTERRYASLGQKIPEPWKSPH